MPGDAEPIQLPRLDKVHVLARGGGPRDGPVVLSDWRPMQVRGVRDGDTLNVIVSALPTLGIEFRGACRVAGVNCPELHNPDRTINPPGDAARTFTLQWVSTHAMHVRPNDTDWPFLTRVDGWDNYGGRFDGAVRCWAGHDLGSDIISSGQGEAKRYGAPLVPDRD